jgi:D-alanyl-D-alanine carboxypeptidase/D-alanyl-D-alanine-endopeptidase (penicillin-binding protein 4)
MMRAFALILMTFSLSGCSVSHYMNREIKKSPILQSQHTGVSVQALNHTKPLVSYQDSKYFIPASNTKLFSFYAGLNALGDSIPGLEYLEWGELLLIRGTGDPSLLHPDLPHSHVEDFLKSRKEAIFYSPVNFQDQAYGPGWAWSDYNDYYQPEKSGLPLYGNIARFEGGSNQRFSVEPKFWERNVLRDTSVLGIQRNQYDNIFLTSKFALPNGLIQDIPVRTSDELTTVLLSDLLRRDVKLISIPLDIELNTVYSIPSDSLYMRMMQVSDNLLAEQLMLVYASANGLPLNSEKAIAHATEKYFKDMPDPLQWKDGSGLSRYNLFTPRTIVALLQKIYDKVPQDRLFKLLPAGGATGTLKNMFKGEAPFIFAKSGSLSNNYNLSGYLITKKGKTLLFSFMNNNFTRPTAEVRKEVERILTGLHNRY